MTTPKRGVKTRNNMRWTEARYFGFIRSALRSAFMKWPAKHTAKEKAKVITEEGARWKCAACKELFLSGQVQVDHIVECGSLKTFDDLPGFVERMFCEAPGFQVLCKTCHKYKTDNMRKKK